MAIENTQSSLMTVRIHWSGVNDSLGCLGVNDSPGCLIFCSTFQLVVYVRLVLAMRPTEELIPPNLILIFEGTTDLFLDRFLGAIPCQLDHRSSCKPTIHAIADQVSQDGGCVHTREFLLEG
jgi:hypothetical protein